ncbi:MAG: carboxypeptidase-like regulatory domain-containing protein [Bryobacterales bacterium]|nr:carboxypeptidase-like regulatory domain-containing protein [Bryobacterales bacterium]
MHEERMGLPQGAANKGSPAGRVAASRCLRYAQAAVILLLATGRPALAQQAGRPSDQAPTSQCLDVQVLDPSAASVPGASVVIGDQVRQAGQSGVASFCGLGPGPHSLVVTAENFEMREGVLDQSEGSVTITLELSSEAMVVVVGSRAPRLNPRSPLMRSSSAT